MCGISIPGEYKRYRAAIGTRDKSNAACSSRASCIPLSLSLSQPPSPSFVPMAAPVTAHGVSRSYSIYFTSTFCSIFSSTVAQAPLYRSTRTYIHLENPGIHPGLLRGRIFAALGGASATKKNLGESRAILSLTRAKYGGGIFRRGYFAPVLLAYPEMESIYNFANGHSVLPNSQLCGIIPAEYTCRNSVSIVKKEK